MMDFPILKSITCSPTEFVSAWVSCYGSGTYSEADYNKGLNLAGQLSPENIQLLFEWKNNGPLSKKKQAVVNGIKGKISIVNDFRQLHKVAEKDFDKFWDFSYDLIANGIVYRVFLAHISRPSDYPMVDQHVLRAWSFLVSKKIEEPEQNKETYLNYRQFVTDMQKQSGKSLREIDKALMALGQFLNSQFNSVIK